MNIVGIETKYGTMCGRDTIYLDSMLCENNELIFKGEANSNGLNNYSGESIFISYELKFSYVLANYQIELDFYESYEQKFSFQEIVDSPWLVRFRELDHSSKLGDNHRHFVLATYDDVFEIVANDYEFTYVESPHV